MRTLYSVILFILMTNLLAACSSTPTSYDLAKEQARHEKLIEKAEEERREKDQRMVEGVIDAMPEWAINPPKPDLKGFYAVGMGDSKKPAIAIKKAELDAQYNLAKIYQQELSGNEKSYISEGDQEDEIYSKVVDSLIAQVSVTGFQTLEKKIVPVQGKVHAYILMRLPYDEFNKTIRRGKEKATSPLVKSAFDDLERKVKERLKTNDES